MAGCPIESCGETRFGRYRPDRSSPGSDEVFILFKGEAVLIAAKPDDKDVHFECVKMKPGVTYNIPAGTWHNIAMDPEVEIIIVEKSDTHKQDCAYLDLTPLQRNRLYAIIEDILK